MRILLSALALLLLITSCQSLNRDGYPIVGYLKTNQHTIALQLGPDGSLYTLRSHEGDLIEANLTESELIAKLPDLKILLERGMADDAGLSLQEIHSLDGFLDSGKY